MTDLMAMVRLSDEVFEGSPCWEWLGAHRTSDDRPILNNQYVYRLFYEALIGPLPRGKGHAGHHRCEHQWCINPWHVAPMSQAQHLTVHGGGFTGDMIQAAKTHCPAGHPYDEANTYRVRGERHCRACSKKHSATYYYAHLDKCRTKARERMRRKANESSERVNPRNSDSRSYEAPADLE